MPFGTGLLNFAVRHPVMTATPLIGGGAYLASKGAQDPESMKRRMMLGAAAGGLASLTIPGVRQGAGRFLTRQWHGLTGHVPETFKPSQATLEAVEKAKKGVVLGEAKPSMFSKLRYGKEEATQRAQAAASKKAGELAQKLNKLNLSNKDLYWLEAHSPNALSDPKQIYELLHTHSEGMSTLPEVVKNLKNPATFAKKWWQTTPTGTKLMMGGFTGLGAYSGIKQGDPTATGSSIGNNLGWLAAGATPMSVWMPMSYVGGAAGKLVGKAVSRFRSPSPGITTAPGTMPAPFPQG